ncbi:MAG TPA: phage holin family protein [Candidatus Tetragenococcus pullicola]|nr:phage holin family protein [Candidatus Tetragenococcus pullicola]
MSLQEVFLLIKEQKILFLLSLLSIAMVIDFLSGLIAAKITNTITSKIGINGILRKVASIMLLVFFIPVAMIIPNHSGLALVYILYLGYLLMEIQSILENYQKMGIDIHIFNSFLEKLITAFQHFFH